VSFALLALIGRVVERKGGLWEYYAALLPICFEDRRVGSDVETTPVSGRPILAEDAANQAERRRFLEALLNIYGSRQKSVMPLRESLVVPR
jgi:hypothetical protein